MGWSKLIHTMAISRICRASALVLLIVSIGCGPTETAAQRHREANTPAGKAGQAAHKVALQAEKAGRAVGRSLDKAAHDAHEGWKEDAHKDRSTK